MGYSMTHEDFKSINNHSIKIKNYETKSQKTITSRINCFVNYRDSVSLISINQVFNSKLLLTWTKIQKTNTGAKLTDYTLSFAGKNFHFLLLKFLQLF